ncbi:MAG: hypothetical protein O9290_16480 [Microcystis sp. LE19-41.2A]|jgi:hypothetical protein|nr:hypothetical protein [Microcystis sp. LE19-41.2A]
MAKAISLDFSELYKSATGFYGFFPQQPDSRRDFAAPPHRIP